MPDPEHKKSLFPYVEPTVETADEIETKQKLIDDDFIDLQTKFDKVKDVATEQKKQKKIEDTIQSVTDDDTNPFSTFDDFWWEDDMFNKRDSIATVNASKNIINEISDNILRNLRPIDNRTDQELIDDQFIPIDDRTQQELIDDNYISLDEERIETSDDEEAIEPVSQNVIKDISDNILRNLRPVDNRTDQELIDDQFIPIDDRTQQELEDDDYVSLDEEIINTSAAWNPKKLKYQSLVQK